MAVIEWFNLGLDSVDPSNSMEVLCAIQTNHEDVSARCRATLIKWLESEVDASWEKLIVALKMLKLNMWLKQWNNFWKVKYLDIIL